MVATVRGTTGFTVLDRRRLFRATDLIGSAPHANYDISPYGRSFVMVQRSPASRIVVLQNLPELLRRLRTAGASRQSP
jgi:hypothetical protein